MDRQIKIANIPESSSKRVVIVGAGFAGINLAKKLIKSDFQVVVIDRYNFHTFQPLLYQVATAGLEPSAIAFPLRKIFQNHKQVYFRLATLKNIVSKQNFIETDIGRINYDYLVLAMGAKTNYFGNPSLANHAFAMKSIPQAINIRNSILKNYEEALTSRDPEVRTACMNIVVVGGGPTGVELAGALAEMKKYVLPKDYPELDFNQMNIYLIEAHDHLLKSMDKSSGKRASDYLHALGVDIKTNTLVKDYDGLTISLASGEPLRAKTLIWAAGIMGNIPCGIDEQANMPGNRLNVDGYNRVKGYENIFAVGDLATMSTIKYPNGHPQLAPVAVQQALQLAENLKRMQSDKNAVEFEYIDKGSLATVGRNRAIAELGNFKFYGISAWFLWLFVHIMSILGVKNKLFIFINWAWNYVTYDQSLRLMIPREDRN